jgi:acetyl-CoA carboxylase carboxyl transferase subunit alpha
LEVVDFLKIAHHNKRPNSQYYIKNIFPDFIEISGDRLYGDDPSVVSGIATIDGIPVTVIGQLKGRNLEEHINYNFSMSKPEGYRKILRLMKQAEKFRRPVICFVDTLGAYPGKEAEERGQGNAIADCLMESMHLQTPIISILLGDGGSGGALALCIADLIVALEYATLSVIAPKACANILWKDSSREIEAATLLKMQANALFELGVVNKILSEPEEGAHMAPDVMADKIYELLKKEIKYYMTISIKKLIKERIDKFNNIGNKYLING